MPGISMSTGQYYLEDTSADVVLFQELRTDGDSLLAAQQCKEQKCWSAPMVLGRNFYVEC